MAQSQAGYGSAFQDFLRWQYRIRKSGCRGPENIIGPTYISQNALEEKLTEERIELLLEEIFQHRSRLPVNIDLVRTHYLRPFAILLSAGYGHMISYVVEHRSLQDRFLPFLSEPKDFPKPTTRNLWQEFYKEQWQFCAVKLKFDMNYNLENDDILPILEKTEVGRGGSAVLYIVIVAEAYNALVPAEHTDAVFPPLDRYSRLLISFL